jgi:hypothetical protein
MVVDMSLNFVFSQGSEYRTCDSRSQTQAKRATNILPERYRPYVRSFIFPECLGPFLFGNPDFKYLQRYRMVFIMKIAIKNLMSVFLTQFSQYHEFVNKAQQLYYLSIFYGFYVFF